MNADIIKPAGQVNIQAKKKVTWNDITDNMTQAEDCSYSSKDHNNFRSMQSTSFLKKAVRKNSFASSYVRGLNELLL